jgi:hypothetical protein
MLLYTQGECSCTHIGQGRKAYINMRIVCLACVLRVHHVSCVCMVCRELVPSRKLVGSGVKTKKAYMQMSIMFSKDFIFVFYLFIRGIYLRAVAQGGGVCGSARHTRAPTVSR